MLRCYPFFFGLLPDHPPGRQRFQQVNQLLFFLLFFIGQLTSFGIILIIGINFFIWIIFFIWINFLIDLIFLIGMINVKLSNALTQLESRGYFIRILLLLHPSSPITIATNLTMRIAFLWKEAILSYPQIHLSVTISMTWKNQYMSCHKNGDGQL